jgi:hypothetical protein
MTEAEWNTCTSPEAMLTYLRATGRASERNLRLFACACCYQVWPLLDHRCRKAVEAAEAFADGRVAFEEMEAASFAAEDASNEAFEKGDAALCNAGGAAILSAQAIGVPQLQDVMANIIVNVAESAEHAGLKARSVMRHEIAALLRDHVGNPFQPVSFSVSWQLWNEATILKLAQAIYDDRELPSGHLDKSRLAVLGDALEEAGCTDAELQAHVRSPGPHSRGCWALDLILGKS